MYIIYIIYILTHLPTTFSTFIHFFKNHPKTSGTFSTPAPLVTLQLINEFHPSYFHPSHF